MVASVIDQTMERSVGVVHRIARGRYAISLAMLLLAGCGGRETSHWLEIKPSRYQDVSNDDNHRPMYRIYGDGPKVYLSYSFDRKVSSICTGWFLYIPVDRISRGENEINKYDEQQGAQVSIGVASGGADQKMDLHKVVLIYDGAQHRPVSVTRGQSSGEISGAVNIPSIDWITWYKLQYDVRVNVRKPFQLEIGGISKAGTDVPSKLVSFTTKEVVKEDEYGEAGCPP